MSGAPRAFDPAAAEPALYLGGALGFDMVASLLQAGRHGRDRSALRADPG